VPGSVDLGRAGRARRAWFPWRCCVVAALPVILACTDLLGPDRLVTPALQRMVIDEFATSLRDGGLLFVYGFPSDTTFRLETRQRVPIEIAVTSGDREGVGLYRRDCPARERGPGFPCFQFLLGMQDGFSAADLADRVAALGGRFYLVSRYGRFAGVMLFSPENLVRRARSALSWPGVKYVEFSYPFCLDDDPGCVRPSDLSLPVPVDTGAAVAGDGILQVRSGDTVVITYRQPFGGVLETRRVVP